MSGVDASRWRAVSQDERLQLRPILSRILLHHSLGLSVLAGLLSLVGAAFFAPNGLWFPFVADQVVWNSSAGAALAIAMAIYLTRKIVSLPLVHALAYVVVSIAAAFWIVWWGLKPTGFQFANTQFFCSMGLFSGLMVALALVRRRYGRPTYLVIPGSSKMVRGHVRAAQLAYVATVDDPVEDYQGVIADLSGPLSPEWERFLARQALRGIQVIDVGDFNESAIGCASIDDRAGHAFVTALPALIYPQIKRVFDLVTSLVLLAPVGLVVAACGVLIWWEDGGPVFFRQDRMGYRGKTFRVWKLRTMQVVQDAAALPYTEAGDLRITRVGAFLRRYRLDELPQIFNIIVGEMSWIGPRPEALGLAHAYADQISYYSLRHVIRPGISGWAQVHLGNVAKVDQARRKLEYDFFYIKHLSFWLDIVIALKTIRTLWTGFGAR